MLNVSGNALGSAKNLTSTLDYGSLSGGSAGAAAAVVGFDDDIGDQSETITMALTVNPTVEVSGGDRHALLYIVVVLAFYAIGIITALTMYLKQERADIDEEKAYDEYAAFHRDPYKWARYYRMQQVSLLGSRNVVNKI